MIRHLDSVGRVCIPNFIRKQHNWTEETDLRIVATPRGAVIEKDNLGCSLCGDTSSMQVELLDNGSRVCIKCIKKIKEVNDEYFGD